MSHSRMFLLNSPEETRAFAARVGERLRPGAVLCLIGDLGAGKTTFTQGLALGLGLPTDEPVRSPTFTLISEHPGGRLPLYHLDVYRLDGPDGLADLGFDDYISGDGVTVIEWADKVADALPPDRLEIHLEYGDAPDTRRITLTARGAGTEGIFKTL